MLPEWMIVAVFYMHGMPVQADANLIDPAKIKSEAECKAALQKYADMVREKYGFETAAQRVPVYPPPPDRPAGPAKPNDPASEVKS